MTTLSHYGHHANHGLFLAGDCIITYTGEFIFPAENMSHYDINGEEFHLHENLENIPGPRFFPGISHPTAQDLPQDWQQERQAVSAILHTLILDLQTIIGEGQAQAAVATVLAYTTHPFLSQYTVAIGKPGLWIHGQRGSGKSILAETLMRLCGMRNHFPLTRDATPTAYERTFATYCGIPVHIDEWRNSHLKANRYNQSKIETLLSNTFTGLAIAKGTSHISKSIHLVTPNTVPIITGEETTNDAALLSRYIVIQSKADPSIPLGDHAHSIRSIMERSSTYYLITRYILRHFTEFISCSAYHITDYHGDHNSEYNSARTLENHAVIHGALAATLALITAPDPNNGQQHLDTLATWLKSNCHA